MTKKTFVPASVAAFKCIMCGKCCGGWQINLSKKDYDLIAEKLSDISAGRKKIEDIVVLSDHSSDSNTYACFKFNNQGKCFFLDESNSCRWFSSYGKENGAFVCQTFPVFNFLTPRGQFYNISFYCSAAALFLFDEDFQFGSFEDESSFVTYEKNMSDFCSMEYIQTGLDVYINWDAYYDLEEMIKEFYFNHKFSFADKIFLIVHFISLLYLSRERKIDLGVFKPFASLFKSKQDEIVEELSSLDGDVSYQLENIKHILFRRKALYPTNLTFAALVDEADVFLKDIEKGCSSFLEKYSEYNELFSANEKVFEKYFFSRISYNLLMAEHGISAGLKIAVWLYIAVRFFTVARLGKDCEFKEVLISAICDVEKYFFHDRKVFAFWARSTAKEPCILSMDIIRMVRI